MTSPRILAGLVGALTLGASHGEVVINELSATDAGRVLRWDDNDQPYAGAGPAWWAPGFDDSRWDLGDLPMGYSLGSIATDLRSALINASPSFYTRKTFDVSAAEAASSEPLDLNVNYNDGFIVWVNGVEYARANMGAAKAHVYHDQVAYRSNGSTTTPQNFELGTASDILTTGENVIAIQVNNQTLSGNMRLDFELEIDNSDSPDINLVPFGTSVRYLPGLREPSSDLVEPAKLAGADPDDDPSDWIELHNGSPAAVDLAGWSLSDDPGEPAKWTFPTGTTIPAGGYLVVLCDNPQAPIAGAEFPHANFKLAAAGDFVGLYDAGGIPVDLVAPEYPKQHANYSYGRDHTGAWVYCGSPTPGGANTGPTYTGKADAPDFDNKGGFYTSPVTVTLTSETPGVTIRYTTDGTEPTLINGQTYTAPLQLATINTRKGHVIRARSFGAGLIPSNVKTHSFLIGQDARVLGNPALVFAGDPQRSLYDPFGALAINGGSYVDNRWQPTGIADYNNVINRGRAYERPIHAEFYFPDGEVGFRTDVGLRAAASSYSRPRMQLSQLHAIPWPASAVQKPSFNLYFRDEYGNPSVRLPLNGPDHPVDTYERFRIRAGKNDIKNPFVIDELVRRLSRDMGNGASIGVINSLYVNGELKGFYNMVERLREPFFRSLYSSDGDAQWDVLQLQGGGSNVAEGDMVAWNDMIARLNAPESVANWERVLEVADVINMADYYLLNIYCATWDWPHNNWAAARERSPEGRYRLFVWDAEGAFNNRGNRPVSQEMINSFIASGSGELRDLWRGLNRWGEFRLLFADRINKHMFNGGVLDDRDYENSHLKAEFDKLVADFDDLLSLMNGEVVQTGKPRSWANPSTGRRGYLFGPRREEFRDNDLWPVATPPQFSQFGGAIAAGGTVALTNESGDIYYTTDGSDPRLPGGAPNPGATSQPGSLVDETLVPLGSVWKYNDFDGDLGSAWSAAEFDDATWPEGPAPLGYGSIRHDGVTIPIATEINNTAPRQPTVYLRKDFQIDNAASYLAMTLKLRVDAGAVVFLNGTEIFRESNIPLDAVYETVATSDASDSEEGDLDEYALDPATLSALVDGTNTIGVELRNRSVSSSDLVLDLQLDARRTNDDNTPVPVTGDMTISARTFDGGVWSALTRADFTLATTPADSTNLAITEMLYNPGGASADELAAGHDDGDLFEFLRVENIGDSSIDLRDVRFTNGIAFDYSTSAIRSLPPGGKALIVSDLDAFRFRNGNRFDPLIAGQYSGRLNNGGESIRLIGSGDAVIHEFVFSTSSPWPELADPDGQSIQIIDPAGDHGDGSNWRASGNAGGSPGGALSFSAWQASQFTPGQLADPAISGADADPDRDGWPNFLEFALGSPALSAANGLPPMRAYLESFGGGEHLVLEYTRFPGARSAAVSAEISSDLSNWTAGGVEIPPAETNPDGTVTVRVGHPTPVEPGSDIFRYLRLRAHE